MFQLFKSYQNRELSSDECQPKEENQSQDYHILIGDNIANASTSQNHLCHSESQNSICQSHSSSLENSTFGYNRIYRNYTSSPHLFLLVLFLVIYILLILLGASVFSLFEQKAEFQIRDHLLRTQHNFLAKHPSVDAESLDSFIKEVIKGLDGGVNLNQLNHLVKNKEMLAQNRVTTHSISPTPETNNQKISDDLKKSYQKSKESKDSKSKQMSKKVENKESDDEKDDNIHIFSLNIPRDYSNWEFTSSLLFVTSVVTTIGYGHITPITAEGKIFCLVFSCVAIPFTLVFLSIIVSLLKNGPVKVFEKWLIRAITENFGNIPEFWIRILHVIIVTIILLLLILIFPAIIFSNIETDWSFLDSIYYCYISLTTVGLGDFVPTVTQFTEYQSLQLYRICIITYLYGGLALIMLWIAVILRIPQLNWKPFLLTEKEEMDELNEHSNIIDYNKDGKQNTYGTEFFPQK